MSGITQNRNNTSTNTSTSDTGRIETHVSPASTTKVIRLFEMVSICHIFFSYGTSQMCACRFFMLLNCLGFFVLKWMLMLFKEKQGEASMLFPPTPFVLSQLFSSWDPTFGCTYLPERAGSVPTLHAMPSTPQDWASRRHLGMVSHGTPQTPKFGGMVL